MAEGSVRMTYFESSTMSIEIRWDDGADPVSVRVARAVTEAVGAADPIELETCLYDVVDPDSLDRLFAPTGSGSARPAGMVAFEMGGYEVVIAADGSVDVSPIEHAIHLTEPGNGD